MVDKADDENNKKENEGENNKKENEGEKKIGSDKSKLNTGCSWECYIDSGSC